MQAETVYESGSSRPDEDEDGDQTQHHQKQQKQTSSTPSNIDRQKLSSQHHSKLEKQTSNAKSSDFLNRSDNDAQYQLNQSPTPLSQQKHPNHPLNIKPGTSTNASNTSLTSTATSSSRGGATNQSSTNLSSRSSNQLLTSHSQHNSSFDSNVISERVKNLATQIYQELKRIISRFNYNEDILSGLMPLIVSVLESLDLALIENQQLQVELELSKDDNEQLVSMFEKEKQAKRAAEKKLIKSEFAFEEDRQKYQHKIESLDNAVKLLELKAKNASDQATRYEEKESERKSDYNKLHDRYTELLKTHLDVVERVRHMTGHDSAPVSTLNVPQQIMSCNSDLTLSEPPAYASTRKGKSEEADLDKTPVMRCSFQSSIRSWNAETELTLEDTSLVILDDAAHAGYSSAQSASETDIDQDKDGDKDSIAYTSMEKEFRKLIQENKDLLNTKNALNVVKDDLIAEVDRLSNEHVMYMQELSELNAAKEEMKRKINDLDNELRKTKNELDKAKQKIRENNEDGIPNSQRKRFDRAEMAKVLMERNNYKERFLELQNAVKYTECVRANKMVENEKSRTSIWKFFSNLFGVPKELLAIGGPGMQTYRAMSASQILSHGSTAPDQVLGSENGNSSFSSESNEQGVVVLGGPIRSTSQRLNSNSDFIFLLDSDLNIDRDRALRQSSRNLDMPGYFHAYGWSLSSSSLKNDKSESAIKTDANADLGISNVTGKSSSALQVPIPQYIRPLANQAAGMKVWCGTAIEMSGANPELRMESSDSKDLSKIETQDNSESNEKGVEQASLLSSNAIEQLSVEVNQALNLSIDGNQSATRNIPTDVKVLASTEEKEEPSSCVWICSTQHLRTQVTIIDIKTKPDELLDHFFIPTFIYCIKALPGAKVSDMSGITLWNGDTVKTGQTEASKASTRTLHMIDQLIDLQKDCYYTLLYYNQEEEKKLQKRKFLSSRQHSSISFENSSPTTQSMEESQDPNMSTTNRNSLKSSKTDAEISKILDKDTSIGVQTLQRLNDFMAHKESSIDSLSQSHDDNSMQQDSPSKETNGKPSSYQPISSFFPTVWLGGKNNVLYIHSAIGQWKTHIASVRLADSILQICHFRGRVFVALADGSVCVFMRNIETREWELSRYLSINIALLSESVRDCNNANADELHSKIFKKNGEQSTSEIPSPKSKSRDKVAGIRCMEIANNNVWIGYRNRIVILDPITLKPKDIFNVVPQSDNQIRQIASMKDGVFICLRSDLILRLYSSLKPYNHIKNIDIEQVVTRFVAPKTFVISHITAMKVVNNSLWIGNAYGVILTIPFKLVSMVSESSNLSEFEDRMHSSLSITNSIPDCDISDAQISFHGHADAVRFFIHSHDLMLSGGLGYLDFRLDADDQSKSISDDQSHLILWHLSKA